MGLQSRNFLFEAEGPDSGSSSALTGDHWEGQNQMHLRAGIERAALITAAFQEWISGEISPE